jgi:hypothetical protein
MGGWMVDTTGPAKQRQIKGLKEEVGQNSLMDLFCFFSICSTTRI